MINEYISWINERVNEALGKYALTCPSFFNSSEPWIVVLLDEVVSEPSTTVENKRSFKFLVEVGYSIEEGVDLSGMESTLLNNFESLINKFSEYQNRSPGIVSGDILTRLDFSLDISDRVGKVVRLGRIVLTIEAVTW